jgi:hypothetical protein
MTEMISHSDFWSENLKKRDHLEVTEIGDLEGGGEDATKSNKEILSKIVE